MNDEERYRLTHELFMLWQMRYMAGGPLGKEIQTVLDQEITLARRLGFKHQLDFVGNHG